MKVDNETNVINYLELWAKKHGKELKEVYFQYDKDFLGIYILYMYDRESNQKLDSICQKIIQ